MRNLYHIQDDDRPVYILAETWGDAVHAWRLLVVEENDIGEDDEEPNPKGVTFVARHDAVLIVPAKHVPPCGGPDGGCTCGLEGGET